MKKLLLSVLALMVATVIFSLDNNQELEDNAIDANLTSLEQKADLKV